jgi:hypothetical protein
MPVDQTSLVEEAAAPLTSPPAVVGGLAVPAVPSRSPAVSKVLEKAAKLKQDQSRTSIDL